MFRVKRGLGQGKQSEYLEWEIAEGGTPCAPQGPRAPTQAYLGVYVFAPRHAGPWLDEGSEISLGCYLRELRKEDLVLYGGEKGAGGGRWLGGSLLAARQGFVLQRLARTCAAPGLGTSPRFWQERAGSARREQRATGKRFTGAGLLGQIF